MLLTTGQIQKAYVACFGRNADIGGLEAWKMYNVQDENQLYQFFVNSAEGQAIYARKSNGEIVEIVYQNALGRQADAPGKTAWKNWLDDKIVDVATCIQLMTETAIENNEQTQSLIDTAVKDTKIEQLELAMVVALGRPATVKEINAGLEKNQEVYNYLQDISKTAEFQNNGKTLYEVLSTKVKDLSASDGNFNMLNLVNLLISSCENPQNNEQTAFSNQVLVAIASAYDMLENPEKEAEYEQKISTETGLAETKSELSAIDESFDVQQDMEKQLSILESYTEPTPQPTPTPIPTPSPSPSPTPTPPENDPPAAATTAPEFKDTDVIDVLDKDDTITISFTEVIDTTKISVSDLQVSNGHTLGTDAKIEAKDAQDNFAKDFVITLGERADVVTGDKITIAKDKVVDNQDLAANSDVEFTLPELPAAPQPVDVHLTIDKEYTLKSINKSVNVTYDSDADKYMLTTDYDKTGVAIVSSDFEGKTISSTDVSSFTMKSNESIENSIDFSGNSEGTKISVTSDREIESSTINGGDGNDTVSVTSEEEISELTIDGGDGDDTVSVTIEDQIQHSTINGGDSNDTITVTSKNKIKTSTIDGGAGDDTVSITSDGKIESSTIDGGDSNDTITVTSDGNIESSTINGGDGNDTVSVTAKEIIKLTINGEDGDDTVSVTIENEIRNLTINGGDSNDTITVTSKNKIKTSTIDGGAGDDTVSVTADRGIESSTINGGDGDDTVSVTSKDIIKTSTIDGGAGNDEISVETKYDIENSTINGGDSNDTISVTSENTVIRTSTIDGGDGNDTVFVTSKEIDSSTINGGEGEDTISVTSKNIIKTSTIEGGDGDDTISLTASNIIDRVNIKGGKGADNITVVAETADRTLKFDYSNADDFTGGETDEITGFDAEDQFVLPSGYSFSRYENNDVIIRDSEGIRYTIATLVGFSGSIDGTNFTTP